MNSNPDGMTDMEFGALVQQVKTVLDNQAAITQTFNAIFQKVEINSKEFMDVSSQLSIHLETSDLRVKEWEKSNSDIKEKYNILKTDFVIEKDKNMVHRVAVETTAKNAKWLPIVISLLATVIGIANLLILGGGK